MKTVRTVLLAFAASLSLSICNSTPGPCDCVPRGPFDCLDCPSPPDHVHADAGDHA